MSTRDAKAREGANLEDATADCHRQYEADVRPPAASAWEGQVAEQAAANAAKPHRQAGEGVDGGPPCQMAYRAGEEGGADTLMPVQDAGASRVGAASNDAPAADPPFPEAAATLPEEHYPTTADDDHLAEGDEVTLGSTRLAVESVLPGGWYRATHRQAGLVVFRCRGQDALWSRIGEHPLLPRVLIRTSEGCVFEWLDGLEVDPPLPSREALACALALAKLPRFFEAQGLAIVDVEPTGFIYSASGPRLRFPPRLVPIGAPLPRVYREGFTPPDVHEGALATGSEGVYLMAGLLLYFLTGQPLSPAGASDQLLADTRVPGLPQLLRKALGSPDDRPSPAAFLAALSDLADTRWSAKPVVVVGAASTVGLNPERLVNEDSYAYVHEVMECSEGRTEITRACVADGMGGLAAGHLASRAAAEAFCYEAIPRGPETVAAQRQRTLQLAKRANEAVLAALDGQDGGSTLTGVLLLGQRLTLAHVGDSRAYRYHAGTLEVLTRDHSLVSAMVAGGLMTEAEAEVSPQRNQIWRSLGDARDLPEDYIDDLGAGHAEVALELTPGDVVLLLTDGVWGEISDDALGDLVAQHASDPQGLADALVFHAIEAGAPDNATALVLARRN